MELASDNEKNSYGAVPVSEKAADKARPSVLAVTGALIFTYALFGGGAFASKFGVHGGSPLLFEMIREAIAGPFMFAYAVFGLGGPLFPAGRDVLCTVLTCLAFVGNQVMFMMGLKLTEPIFAACWQIAIPIVTTLIATLAGFERSSTMKSLGIFTACSGAIAMNILQVALTPHTGAQHHVEIGYTLAGHACFLLQAFSTCAYILVSKSLLEKYSAVSVTGWSFTLGGVFMLGLTLLGFSIPALHSFLCFSPEREAMELCSKITWTISSSMIAPLIYEIVGCSFMGWLVITWANQYADASTVSIYTVVQPLSTAVIAGAAVLLKGSVWAQTYSIEKPGIQHLVGFVIISGGLYLLFLDNRAQRQNSPRLQKEKEECVNEEQTEKNMKCV